MSDEGKLIFKQSKTSEDIKAIFNFNVQAFADTQEFEWSEDNIKKEIKDGWTLYSVNYENDIVAAIFMKIKEDSLLTKNTPIKLSYQGNGFSHRIKDFYEEIASQQRLKRIVNYCPFDNFRMVSLNEGHNYKRTGVTLGEHNEIIEWEKKLN